MTTTIIGLELMDGSVWYRPQDVLTNATGSYFSARFGKDCMIPAGAERTDEKEACTLLLETESFVMNTFFPI